LFLSAVGNCTEDAGNPFSSIRSTAKLGEKRSSFPKKNVGHTQTEHGDLVSPIFLIRKKNRLNMKTLQRQITAKGTKYSCYRSIKPNKLRNFSHFK
jgi:hypothetical protein